MVPVDRVWLASRAPRGAPVPPYPAGHPGAGGVVTGADARHQHRARGGRVPTPAVRGHSPAERAVRVPPGDVLSAPAPQAGQEIACVELLGARALGGVPEHPARKESWDAPAPDLRGQDEVRAVGRLARVGARGDDSRGRARGQRVTRFGPASRGAVLEAHEPLRRTGRSRVATGRWRSRAFLRRGRWPGVVHGSPRDDPRE